MALNMSNATYARDKAGRENLIKNLQGDIDRIIKKMQGSDYETVIKTVEKYWAGDDADKFIKAFKKSVKDVAKDMALYKAEIANAIKADSKYFAKLQTKNVGTIKTR